MKDVIFVTADSYQEKVLEGLLPRIPTVSRTRNFTYDIIRNPRNDSGSYNDSHELLRPSINHYRYAMVIFDFEGSGAEIDGTRATVEGDVESLLSRNGWTDRNCVVVIEPELETWMWIDNPNIELAIGWDGLESLYSWARANGKILPNAQKPARPKESLEEALRIAGTPKSSSIYKRIATEVSYRLCTDPAFLKFISTLQMWFPVE